MSILKYFGLFLIILGLVFNPWLIANFFSPDNHIKEQDTQILIIFVEIFLILLGMFIIKFPKTEIILLICSIFIGSLICLAIISLFLPIAFLDIHTNDFVRHHRTFPNTLFRSVAPDYQNVVEAYLLIHNQSVIKKTNSFGFVDNEVDVKDSSKIRILLLGDSFTEGSYLENNFADILEDKLKQISPNYEVINTGLGSYSPIIEYNLLKYYGFQFKPKIVILNLDMTDVADDFRYSQQDSWLGENGLIKELPKDSYKVRLAFVKIKLFIKQSLNLLQSLFRKNEIQNLQEAVSKKILEKQKMVGNISSDILYSYTYKNETEFKLHFQETLRHINRIKKLSEENNIIFILHVYPHSMQISKEYNCFRQTRGLEPNKIYSNLIFDELEKASKDLNINLWQSRDTLKNAEKPPYYECDIHVNDYGHELIADFLFQKLIAENLI